MRILATLLIALALAAPPAAAPVAPGAPSRQTRLTSLAPGRDREVRCFGANAASTRYLLGEVAAKTKAGALVRVTCYDAVTGRETGLAFSQGVDLDDLYDKLVKKSMDAEQEAQLLELMGGREQLLLALLWRSPPMTVETVGDSVLVYSGYAGYILVDVRAGTVSPLMGTATLVGDGRAVVCAPNMLEVYDPATGAYAPIPVSDGQAYSPLAARLLQDGTAVMSVRSNALSMVDKKMTHETYFAFIDDKGAAKALVDLGVTQLGHAPDRLLYSESMGMGLAYNLQTIFTTPLYQFDEQGAGVLRLDHIDAPKARVVPLSQAEQPDAQSCVLVPLGLTGDQRMALFVELRSGCILRMDLSDYGIAQLATAEQIGALLGDTPYNLVAMSALGYNGGHALTSWQLPPGTVLELPHG